MDESKHFELHEIAPGVWASIHKPGGWAIGNAGIMDLGDLTLVFDSHMTPAAGADLRAAAVGVTGRPPTSVILSHYHNDHIWGAQAFQPEATVYTTHENKTLIETQGQEEYDYFNEAAPGRFAELQEQAEAGAEDPMVELMLPYFAGIVQSMPILKVQSPEVTFSDRLVFQGSRRQAEILTYGGGHTANDAFLHLPEEGIIFMSDLLFAETVPYLADGDPWEKLRILDKIEALGAQTLVPGHGPVSGPEQLQDMKTYISMVDQRVATAVETGLSLEQVLAEPPPALCDGWDYPVFHSSNVRFFYQHYEDNSASAD
jgi:glyoxylase-like metal-dependent hydrolase (beta-lactamase superfamily II)